MKKIFTIRLLFQIYYIKIHWKSKGQKLWTFINKIVYFSESVMQACVIHSLGMLLAESMKVTNT